MSWDSLTRRGMVLGAVALSGCGFRPLYGDATTGGAGGLFGAVRLAPTRGERAYVLREALIERLGAARADAPLSLSFQTQVTEDGLLVEQDDAITRYNVTMQVQYRLMRGETEVETGSVQSVAAYNATSSQYATLVSRRDVEKRAAEDAADKIVKRLAAAWRPDWV